MNDLKRIVKYLYTYLLLKIFQTTFFFKEVYHEYNAFLMKMRFTLNERICSRVFNT